MPLLFVVKNSGGTAWKAPGVDNGLSKRLLGGRFDNYTTYDLTERRGVQQATVSPLGVQTARQVEWSQVLVVDFGVVTDLLDNLVAEVVVQAHGLAQIAFDAQHIKYLGIVTAQHLVHVGG